MLKQTLGWTAPKLREPAAADRWTWLVIAAHTQLRLARPLAEDLRNPWERPARQGAPHTRERPSRISPPPQENASAGQRTENHHRGSRQADRDQEQAPRTRAPRRETGQTCPCGGRRKQQSCINVKLRARRESKCCFRWFGSLVWYAHIWRGAWSTCGSFSGVVPTYLDERQRRLLIGAEARIRDTAESGRSLRRPRTARPASAKAWTSWRRGRNRWAGFAVLVAGTSGRLR